MSQYTVELPPRFVTGVFLSAWDIEVLRQNAIALDALSYRRESFFDSTGAHGDPVSYNWHKQGDFLLWKGALRYRTGYTTLTIEGEAASYGAASLVVKINGVSVGSITLGATFSEDFDISADYSDGDILIISIETSGNTSRSSEFIIHDVYATPITPTYTWTAVPTFAGTYTAANLQVLADNCVYLHDRMNQLPLLPHLAHIWRLGTHKVQDLTLYTGTASRYVSNEIIRIIGNVTVANTTERLLVYLNSVLAYTGTNWSPGTYTFSIPLTFPGGVGVGDRCVVTIVSSVTAAPSPNPTSSRYNFLVLRSDPDASGYAVQTPPVAVTANGPLYSATTINNTLNAVGTMLTNIKNRLDSSHSFDRARAMRYQFGIDDHQWEKMRRTYPQTFVRRGSKLIVSGKNVTLGFGSQEFEKDEDGNSTYKYKLATEQTLIGGDKVETQTIYLDSIKGLYPGMLYYLIGDVQFASEYLY